MARQESTIEKTLSKDGRKAMDFFFAIAMRESGVLCENKPPNEKATNKFGYRGMFQFGHSALAEVGYDTVTLVKFKKNPQIWPLSNQYDAMHKLLRSNYKNLKWYIKRYQGKEIRGIKITETGVLAAAHLLGWARVKEFLLSDGEFNPRDGFKTSLIDYLKLFQNYECRVDQLDSNFYDISYHYALCDSVRNKKWSFK